MKKFFYFLLVTSLSFAQVQKAQTLQVGNTSTTAQSNSAVLQIDDTNRGFLPPRMSTAQRDAITSPATGLTIYNLTKNCIEWYNGFGWYNQCGDNDISVTSGGTAIVTQWNCDVASSGTLTYNVPVSGVTQTVQATVAAKGDYNISAVVNGITFVGSGMFSSTGQQNVVLTATGTPTTIGTNTFTLSTTPGCSFDRAVAATIASVPTNVTALASPNSASVSFSASVDNGGDSDILYIVVSNPDGITATGSISPITVTGLTNGTNYTFSVKATNAAGDSNYSTASNAVIPIGPPTAPAITSVTSSDQSATIAFTAPESDGGSFVTGYTVTSSPGDITATGTSSPITVTGLTNGTAYTFTMVATNEYDDSPVSNLSDSVTPSTVPTAPAITSVSYGIESATVAFTAPTDNGGAPITSYTITSNPEGITATGTSSPITVTGLTNGTAYTFTMVATNTRGNSLDSSVSNSITPVDVPNAPTITAAQYGNASAVISFTPPTTESTRDAVTGYTVTSSPGGFTATGTSSPITVSGLNNGTAYTFTMVATSSVGNSVLSNVSDSVTPRTVPTAPVLTAAAFGNDGEVSVSFNAPSSNGGAVITNYVVSTSTGITASGNSSPIVVTGLTNGISYSFTVVAQNSEGSSPSSNAVSQTPMTVPTAPVFTSITQVSTNSATVVLNVNNNGGSAVTGYTVTATPGNIIVNSISNTVTINGLTVGEVYTFNATATNAVGTSPVTTTSLNMNRTGELFTSHYNGVVNGTYTGSNTTITHSTGEVFSNYNDCKNEFISTQKQPSDCPNTVTSFDGQRSYSTAFINGQCWINQNIQDYPNPLGAPRNTPLSTVRTTDLVWAAPYNNSDSNLNTYGLLYQYSAAMNRSTAKRSQGVCPSGWHVPSSCEYRYLVFGLGHSFTNNNSNGAIMKMMAQGYFSGNNASNFNGVPGGSTDSGYININVSLNLRISDIDRFVQINNTSISTNHTLSFVNTRAFSLRCIKN